MLRKCSRSTSVWSDLICIWFKSPFRVLYVSFFLHRLYIFGMKIFLQWKKVGANISNFLNFVPVTVIIHLHFRTRTLKYAHSKRQTLWSLRVFYDYHLWKQMCFKLLSYYTLHVKLHITLYIKYKMEFCFTLVSVSIQSLKKGMGS